MNFANTVKNQIKEYYGVACNRLDLIKHLKNNTIDCGLPTLHLVKGFDESYDGSMITLYFIDASALIISLYSIVSVIVDKSE